MGKIDLHVHTKASSDGELSGEEIIRLALKEDVVALAITDHDSVDEVNDAVYWGEKLGVEVIPGTEVFCKHRGKSIHMLSYFFDMKDSPIIHLIDTINEGRRRWVKEQIEVLQKHGIYAREEKVYEFCGNTPPLNSSIAYAVIEDERNKGNQLIAEYKDKYDNPLHEMSVRLLAYGKPYYCPHYVPEAREVISAAKESGGLAVLAHPGYRQMEVDFENTDFIDSLVEEGLSGIEAIYSTHTEEETKTYLDYCRKKGLIHTSGSDFHGKYKPDIQLGQLNTTDYSIVEKLKAERDKIIK